MDMDSILGTILRAILNYKRVPMSTLNGPLVKQILTVAHFTPNKRGLDVLARSAWLYGHHDEIEQFKRRLWQHWV